MKRLIIHICNVITVLFSPILIPVYMFAFLIFSRYGDPSRIKLVQFGIAILFSSALHMIPMVLMKRSGKIKSFDLVSRDKRALPLLFGIWMFIIGYVILKWFDARPMTLAAMFCYIFNTIIVFIITNWYKISLHTIGVTGPLVVLAYAFGPVVYPFFVLIPIVATSRVILKRHTLGQVIAGAAVGLFVTPLVLYLYFL